MQGATKAPAEASPLKNPGESIQASPYKWAEAINGRYLLYKLPYHINNRFF
jgi:hypothetical protein